MSEEMSKLSVGSKLIIIGAGHITLNGALLLLGKEAFLEIVPAAKALFAEEIGTEIIHALLISVNTLPLTLAVAYIVYNWKNFTGDKIISASVVLWVCLFIGSWLHLGINYDQLFPGKALSLTEYLSGPGKTVFIQLLTYPLAVFFTVYKYAMFCTSLLVGYVAATALPGK